jgi:hypothetical protein
MPRTIILSLVSVPVLSKQQMSTLPALGMRKGSVQKTLTFITGKEAGFTLYMVTIIEIYSVKPDLHQRHQRVVDREGELHRQLRRDHLIRLD